MVQHAPSFSANTSTASPQAYSGYANAIVLRTTTPVAASRRPPVSKSFSKGFYASLAYTYSMAMDVTQPGSTASSTWAATRQHSKRPKNWLTSSFAVPHRIIGTFLRGIPETPRNHHFVSFTKVHNNRADVSAISMAICSRRYRQTGFSNTADINYDGNSST